MILTNSSNLPLPLFEALKADPYDNEGSDISVTGLLKPVQQWVLGKRYGQEIETDCADRLWATYGQLMALLLERVVLGNPDLAKRFEVERRVHTMVNGWKLSGQFDIYDRETCTLSDYKFVGSFAAKKAKQGEKDEWVKQLNVLRWLKSKHDSTQPVPENLEIVLLLRDHTAKSESEGLQPVEVIDIPVMPMESVELWAEGRVKEFQDALKLSDFELPDCTAEERWNGRRCAKYCDVAGKCIQELNHRVGSMFANPESEVIK